MQIEELAAQVIKTVPRERLLVSGAYMALAICYGELVERKEIKRIEDLDEETKRRYWNETEGMKNETFSSKRPIKRLWCVQALMIYDLIKPVTGGTPP